MAKKLTEKQQAFLHYLFSEETGGDPLKAKKLAGYDSTTTTQSVVNSLQDEIIERTKEYLVQNGPKAAVAVSSLISDPTQLGAKNKLNAAKDILDRVGVTKTEKVEIKGGLFVLPPKDGGA